MPRPHRRDGEGHAGKAPQHELVSRLSSQRRAAPAPRVGGHQHEMDAAEGRSRARREAREQKTCSTADRLLGVPQVTRTYWRSPGQLEDAPEFRDFLQREFPEGASELPQGVTRREMMMLLGASLSLAGAAGCRRPVEQIVPYVNAPGEIVPGVPRYYATTMPFLRSAYGLIVESHEGRPTKIEGNPRHPSTMGASSLRIQAAMVNLYDPDRSQTQRLQGEAKAWSDFVTAWGEIAKSHAADGGAGLAILSESFSSPTLARLSSEFRSRYPRARWATYEPVSDENRLSGVRSATGRNLETVLHLDRARVILALDSDFLLADP